MLFQAVYRRFCSRNNGILAWCEVAIRNRVAKTPDFSIGVNVASMGVVMGRAGVFGGSFLRGAFCRFFCDVFIFFGTDSGGSFLRLFGESGYVFMMMRGLCNWVKICPQARNFCWRLGAVCN